MLLVTALNFQETLEVVWPQYLALAIIGTVLFALALVRFRRTIAALA
nr:hypothetical protein [Desulfobulbus elongatus]